MKLNNTTPVPNAFFDGQIKDLSGSAIRIYLKIIRNLLGWRDENGNVKQKDWIAHSQFEKTGLSNRSVTNGIQELLDKKLIQVTDYLNNDLTDPFTRKKAKRVYYALILENHRKNYVLQKKFLYQSTVQKKKFLIVLESNKLNDNKKECKYKETTGNSCFFVF